MQLPILDTARLRLMPLQPGQAARLAQLADDPAVESYTAAMPSPYTHEHARKFIAGSALAAERDEDYVFGIHTRDELIGVINLKPLRRHRSGHLGFWMGAEFRNYGFMTEAVRQLLH